MEGKRTKDQKDEKCGFVRSFVRITMEFEDQCDQAPSSEQERT